MVDVICDTNFLILLATKRIKNISTIDTDIGQITFVVPEVVIKELEKLLLNTKKNKEVKTTLEFIKNYKKIPIKGNFADNKIIAHVKEHGGFIATVDKELKNKIKNVGGSIISLSNDRIVLESS